MNSALGSERLVGAVEEQQSGPRKGPGNLGQRTWPLQYLRFTYVYKGWAQISPLTLHQRFPSFQR